VFVPVHIHRTDFRPGFLGSNPENHDHLGRVGDLNKRKISFDIAEARGSVL
jgi:hypothetical protein